MLDQTTTRGRILAAALATAASKSWSDVTLREIADGAGVQLSDFRNEFAGKTEIIAALLRAVDDEVLKKSAKSAEGEEKRDHLFDIIMTRFDVLAPYKAALKSIYAAGPADFSLAGPYLSSQHWMLQAAGIGTDGASGAIRVSGLAIAYASVFRTWLADDDPGLAPTMAALDRRLRSGERTVQAVEGFATAVQRLATEGPGFLRSVLRGRPTPGPTPSSGSNPAPGSGTV